LIFCGLTATNLAAFLSKQNYLPSFLKFGDVAVIRYGKGFAAMQFVLLRWFFCLH